MIPALNTSPNTCQPGVPGNWPRSKAALGEANAADIHVMSDGRFLYASERHISPLTGFRIDMANDFLAPLER